MSVFLKLMYTRKIYMHYTNFHDFSRVYSLQTRPKKSRIQNYISRVVDHWNPWINIYESVLNQMHRAQVPMQVTLETCGVRAQIKDQLSCLSLHIDVDKNNSSVLQRVMVPGDDTVTEL